MAVLVTGGAGYIGSVLVERLLAASEEVIVLDDLSTGHAEAVPRRVEFIQQELQHEGGLWRTFEEFSIDTVMHLAASIEVAESVENPLKYFDNNIGGTIALLNAMKRFKVQNLVFSSTAAVYGNTNQSSITEELPAAPSNPYGISKCVAEQMLESCAAAHPFRYVALRYFNAAGASKRYGEAHRTESHLIPNVLRTALGTRPSISVFGTDYDTPDGTCVRDYVHVEDLADAHLKAMAYLRAHNPSETVNVGNGRGYSVLEVIETARRVTGRDISVKHEPRRPGDSARLVAAIGKAQRMLKWSPHKPDLETIVADAWRWMEQHPNGYQA